MQEFEISGVSYFRSSGVQVVRSLKDLEFRVQEFECPGVRGIPEFGSSRVWDRMTGSGVNKFADSGAWEFVSSGVNDFGNFGI